MKKRNKGIVLSLIGIIAAVGGGVRVLDNLNDVEVEQIYEYDNLGAMVSRRAVLKGKVNRDNITPEENQELIALCKYYFANDCKDSIKDILDRVLVNDGFVDGEGNMKTEDWYFLQQTDIGECTINDLSTTETLINGLKDCIDNTGLEDIEIESVIE